MTRIPKKITVGIDAGDIRGADNRAIQAAVNAIGPGGTVEILPGTYECIDSVHLKSGVTLAGRAEKTVLRRADGFRMPLKISADYGQLKITPVDIGPFRPGLGLYLRDSHSHGVFTRSLRKAPHNAMVCSRSAPKAGSRKMRRGFRKVRLSQRASAATSLAGRERLGP